MFGICTSFRLKCYFPFPSTSMLALAQESLCNFNNCRKESELGFIFHSSWSSVSVESTIKNSLPVISLGFMTLQGNLQKNETKSGEVAYSKVVFFPFFPPPCKERQLIRTGTGAFTHCTYKRHALQSNVTHCRQTSRTADKHQQTNI